MAMKKAILALSAASLACLVIVSPGLAATEGRLAGTVQDPQGNPLEGVQVTVQGVGFDFESVRSSNKKGRFTLLVLDATKDYLIRLEKEGFLPIEEPFDPILGDTLRMTWTMSPGRGGDLGGGGRAGVAPTAVAGKGQAARLYGEGVEALQAGELAKARETFQRVVELEPELAEAHTALAMVYVQEEAYNEAILEADRVLEMRPGDVLALKIQYEAYHSLGDRDKSEEILESLIAAEPDPELARLVFNSGVARIQEGDLEGGADRFEQARQLDPDLLPAYSALARVYFDLKRYDESVGMAKTYLEQDGTNAEVLGVLFLTYEQQGKTAEADETFEALKAANPGHMVGVLEELGVAYFNSGSVDKARTLLERVLDAQPDHPGAHYYLALCYLNTGDTAKAKELLTRFVDLAPDHPEAQVAREMLSTL
jgi:tetratricopeptide (TPR) repeat protein